MLPPPDYAAWPDFCALRAVEAILYSKPQRHILVNALLNTVSRILSAVRSLPCRLFVNILGQTQLAIRASAFYCADKHQIRFLAFARTDGRYFLDGKPAIRAFGNYLGNTLRLMHKVKRSAVVEYPACGRDNVAQRGRYLVPTQSDFLRLLRFAAVLLAIRRVAYHNVRGLVYIFSSILQVAAHYLYLVG